MENLTKHGKTYDVPEGQLEVKTYFGLIRFLEEPTSIHYMKQKDLRYNSGAHSKEVLESIAGFPEFDSDTIQYPNDSSRCFYATPKPTFTRALKYLIKKGLRRPNQSEQIAVDYSAPRLVWQYRLNDKVFSFTDDIFGGKSQAKDLEKSLLGLTEKRFGTKSINAETLLQMIKDFYQNDSVFRNNPNHETLKWSVRDLTSDRIHPHHYIEETLNHLGYVRVGGILGRDGKIEVIAKENITETSEGIVLAERKLVFPETPVIVHASESSLEKANRVAGKISDKYNVEVPVRLFLP